ncbi:hypothetical protein CBA19CS91_20505 [Paraburkholderia hospita]|nr:hypothetical protein CBA19CS91_20505 [Paraburkholderia hospita]
MPTKWRGKPNKTQPRRRQPKKQKPTYKRSALEEEKEEAKNSSPQGKKSKAH